MDMEEVQGVTEVVELLEGLVHLVDSMNLTFEEGSKSQPSHRVGPSYRHTEGQGGGDGAAERSS